MVEPLIVPWAVPVSLRSLAQVALNEPLAVLPVCSVMFHLKSAQELGVGMRLDEVQLPSSEPPLPRRSRRRAVPLVAEARRSGDGDRQTDNELCKFLHRLLYRISAARRPLEHSQGRQKV